MEITKKSSDSTRGLHGAYTLETHQVDRLIGQLLTLVDALGLPEKQEKSLKDLVKQKVWETMNNAFYINGKILVLAENIDWEIRDENNIAYATQTSKEERQKGLHPAWIDGEFELKFISKK